jgi:hypothetical protein
LIKSALLVGLCEFFLGNFKGANYKAKNTYKAAPKKKITKNDRKISLGPLGIFSSGGPRVFFLPCAPFILDHPVRVF